MLEGKNVKEFDTLLSKDIIFFLGVKGEWKHLFEEKAHILLSDSNAIGGNRFEMVRFHCLVMHRLFC